MSQIFLRSMASAAGLLALALFFVGLDPFLAGADYIGRTPPVSVNRALKGDRLPLIAPAVVDVPDWRNEFGLVPMQTQAQKPFACDPAFSPIFMAKTANVYRRCLA
jgi:hypothetical protein